MDTLQAGNSFFASTDWVVYHSNPQQVLSIFIIRIEPSLKMASDESMDPLMKRISK